MDCCKNFNLFLNKNFNFINNYLKKKELKLFLIIFFLIIIFSYKKNCNSNYPNKNTYVFNENEFMNILPKTNFEIYNISQNLNQIFKSKQLFINNSSLTKEYINFIRPVNKEEESKYDKDSLKEEIRFNLDYFKFREEKANYSNFGKLCIKEKLFKKEKNEIFEPIISVIVPSFNKEHFIMKSIRSIQNQSFKNIEIIIVDDCSTDNSSKYFNYLLETEPRIRIFHHLKNMGCWRSRLDGFLYSRGKYIIHFDMGDIYSDEFVLEDAYNLIKKYNLDSIKMMFKLIFNYSNLEKNENPFNFTSNHTKIVYGSKNIKKYNEEIFKYWGNIFTRLTKANIIIKGLNLLNSSILNFYKNLWEDIWWNKLINEVSYSFLIINRTAYLYYKDFKGEGEIKFNQKSKMIHEFLCFLYFDLKLLPKKDNKNSVINILYSYYNKNSIINLNKRNSNFDFLNNLILLLINDPYVLNYKKIYLKKLLLDSKQREKSVFKSNNNI